MNQRVQHRKKASTQCLALLFMFCSATMLLFVGVHLPLWLGPRIPMVCSVYQSIPSKYVSLPQSASIHVCVCVFKI